MISVEKAQSIILKHVRILQAEKVKLKDALDRILARDIYAKENIPLLDNSAMDGFAIKAYDTKGASRYKPKTFEVIENLAAGYVASKSVKTGQAIRIMTGAPMPKGADSVVMVENTGDRVGVIARRSKATTKPAASPLGEQSIEVVEVYREVRPGENIRRTGEDIRKGEKALSKGTRLGPGQIGVLASLGKAHVLVAKKPKAAILATGDEVIDIDKKLSPGKLRNSNTYALYGQLLRSGCAVRDLGIAKDRPEALKNGIRKGFGSDIILTSGGVSVGEYDLVKAVLSKMGIDIRFWKVAIKPGKPLVFGTIGKSLVFGLPGNPVSSMVSFEMFVKPAIYKMLGRGKIDEKKRITASLEENIRKEKGRTFFLRAKTRWEQGQYVTRTTGPQGSGILKSMALANSLIVLPEERKNVKKGEEVTVRFLH